MRRIGTMFPLLLSDDRSAVRRTTAVLFSVVVLATAATGLLLVSLGEQTYRDHDRRVLRASQDLASGPLV
jgi:hypothetical protein